MKQIEISKFRTTCHSVLDRVVRTREPVLVIPRGEPIVTLVPHTPGTAGSWLGSMKGSVTIHGDIVAPALESPVVRHPPGT
ncbi:MAG: type II toxin-antitoxin system Phd/YefM family antitoxin [Acidobacteria bacterium]|nr:type II toxin-antitoxin system Phd/YefM family antitoxin [Acidobacteriota bacterium]